jgi:hypothetical protein
VDLDAPAADGDLLDDEAKEALTVLEVELVEGGRDALGEAGEPLAQAVVAGELGPLFAQGLLLGDQLCAPFRQFRRAAGELSEVDDCVWGAFIRIAALSSGNLLAAQESTKTILPW